MGLHKPFDRPMFLVNGSVLTKGGSLDLNRGQVGIFDTQNVSKDGLVAVEAFNGFPKSRRFEIRYRQGEKQRGEGLSRSKDNKTFASYPFTVEDIISIKVETPKVLKATPDVVIVGYNGIDDTTSLRFRNGQSKSAMIQLSGEAIGHLGYPDAKVQIPMFFDAGSLYSDKCTTVDGCADGNCQKIVEQAIESFKQFKLRGGVSPERFVKITPIFNNRPVETEETYNFYELTLVDAGDAIALAAVREQYPGVVVERVKREGLTSVYQLLQLGTAPAPAAFVSSIPSYIKGCAACATGFTAAEGGYVYSFTIEDNGADKSATIQGLTNVVAGSVQKGKGQQDGVGVYTALFSKKISATDIAGALGTEPTLTVNYIGEALSVCNNATTSSTNWVKGKEVKLSTREFIIDLPDPKCDGVTDRLAELQAAYPNLEITKDTVTGGCQTRYKAKVKTNLRGEACDPIFLDMYKAEAPADFDGRAWRPVAVAGTPANKCGFKIEGKILEINPTECVIDEIRYSEDPIKIEVSGGWIGDVREGIGRISDDPFHVEYLSYASKRDKVGYSLRGYEREGIAYFGGGIAETKSNQEKFLQGVESNINYNAQYIDYAITIRRNQFSQGMGGTHSANNTFHIMVEAGKQQKVEKLLNNLAAQAGIDGVRALG